MQGETDLPIFEAEHFDIARTLVHAAERENPPCQQDPELWWATPRRGQDRAVELCQTRCAITSICLEFALRTGEPWGVWGGTTPEDRRIINQQRTVEETNIEHPNTDPPDRPNDPGLQAGTPGLHRGSSGEQAA